MDVLHSHCSLGAGFELTLNVIKGGFGDGGDGRNEMRMEEGEVLISLIRLGRRGAVEATKVRIAGYTSVLDGASALRSLSLGHARSTTEVLICQIKWGSKEWDWGGEWHLGSHPWNEKKEKKYIMQPQTFQYSLVSIIEFVVPF